MSDSVFASQINLQNLTELWRRMGAKFDNRPGLADFKFAISGLTALGRKLP